MAREEEGKGGMDSEGGTGVCRSCHSASGAPEPCWARNSKVRDSKVRVVPGPACAWGSPELHPLRTLEQLGCPALLTSPAGAPG